MNRTRLLYIPNEWVPGWQVGPRASFEGMQRNGFIDAYESFSFLLEAKQSSPAGALDKLCQLAYQFQPTMILWQHVGNFPVTREYLVKLKSLRSAPMLVYHEADAFGLFKPLSKSMKNFAAEAHIVVLVGLGVLADLFIANGAKKIIYAPHSVDTIQFGKSWEPTSSRRFDVVMIGNRITSRIPFKRFPGAVSREKLACQLTKRFGRRFGLFGSGWDGFPGALGPIPFEKQEEIIRDSWISVGWDHFDNIPFYFSDRLPISLLSGVAHVTNYQPGYELLFKNGEQLVFTHTVSETVNTIDFMLSKPRKYLIDMGMMGRQLAQERFTAETVYSELMNSLCDHASLNY
jgi:hypothetical protein